MSYVFCNLGWNSMISKKMAQDILFASVYFRELFKKTLFEATPELVTTKTQINILVSLFAHKPMNVSSLSDITGVAREQITRSVKVLREKNLVECEKRPENRREVIVSLSNYGYRVIREQLDTAQGYLDNYLMELSQEDIDELAELSAKAIQIFEKASFKAIVPTSPELDAQN